MVCQRGRWASKGVYCEISHQLERGTKHSVSVWKPLPSRHALKTLRRSLKGKGKAQTGPVQNNSKYYSIISSHHLNHHIRQKCSPKPDSDTDNYKLVGIKLISNKETILSSLYHELGHV